MILLYQWKPFSRKQRESKFYGPLAPVVQQEIRKQ